MPQIKIEDLGTILFTSTPTGQAPLSIREQWIGVEVPCLFSHDGTCYHDGKLLGVETGLAVPDYPGYIVFQTHALEALEKKSQEAAEYWAELGFPNHSLTLFLFDLDSAKVVNPVLTREEFRQRFNDA